MCSGPEIDAGRLLWLTKLERSAVVLRYIAECGTRYEPHNDFWITLLAQLPSSPLPKRGVLPHPTRFIAMTGVTRRGVETVIEWIRPEPTLAHG